VGRLLQRDVYYRRTFTDVGRLVMGLFESGMFRVVRPLVRGKFRDGLHIYRLNELHIYVLYQPRGGYLLLVDSSYG
jgi:hypothetical protein